MGVDERWKEKFGVWIVRTPDDIAAHASGFFALLSTCTHLGCTPNYLSAESKFKCPCHGSGFRLTGINFEGPAPRPLEHGQLRPLFRYGVMGLGILAPLALKSRALVRGEAPSRPESVLSSLCALVGGYLLRYVMVMAGYASADDPHATFELAQPLHQSSAASNGPGQVASTTMV